MIERLFCRLKNWRLKNWRLKNWRLKNWQRLATRYDCLPQNDLASLALVAVTSE